MKTKTFNVSMPEDLVKIIDTQAKKQFETRSSLLRRLVKSYVAETEAREWDKLFALGRQQAKKLEKLGVKNEQDVIRLVREYRREQQSAGKNRR